MPNFSPSEYLVFKVRELKFHEFKAEQKWILRAFKYK